MRGGLFSSRGAFKDKTCGEDLFSGDAFKDQSFGEDVFSGGAFRISHAGGCV